MKNIFAFVLFIGLLYLAPGKLSAQNINPYSVSDLEFGPTFPECTDKDAKAQADCFTEKSLRFLAQHIKYPQEAKELGIQGKVFIEFIVRKDGSISDIKTIRTPHPSLDAEAHRVVALFPALVPGYLHGEPVDVKVMIPISFQLQ